MGIEPAMQRVSREIGSQSVPLAEEMTLTHAELSYLPERRKAFENLAKRTGLQTVKAHSIGTVRHAPGPGAACPRAGKPRRAHAGGRAQGRGPASKTHRAHDPVFPAGDLRHHPWTLGNPRPRAAQLGRVLIN